MPNFAIPITVDTVAALALVHVAELDNGCLAWVDAVDNFFVLHKVSARTPNGTTVVAPAAGSPIAGAPSAVWVRLSNSEVLRTGLAGFVSGGNTVYLDPNYIGNPADVLGFVMMQPGVLHNLHVLAKTPPTNPLASDVYTVFVNGIASTLTATMTGMETCVIDAEHVVTVAPCDRVSVQLIGSGPTIASDIMVGIAFVPTGT